MPILHALLLAMSTVLLADIDDQPACRQRCDDAWSADLTTCEGLREPGRPPNAVDECRDDANQRHQDCIDDCND